VRPPENPEEPLTRGIALHGMRSAAIESWGDLGLRAIADQLSPDGRGAAIDEIVLPVSWYPSRFNIEWAQAVWNGPAEQNDAVFCAWLNRSIDLGFGKMRSFFLRLVSLELMAARAPSMWRYEHTHGSLNVELRPDRRGALVTVRDHPFVKHAISRRTEAENYRHIMELSGMKDVRETHRPEGENAFSVVLSWRL
jgi:hypothetical protein